MDRREGIINSVKRKPDDGGNSRQPASFLWTSGNLLMVGVPVMGEDQAFHLRSVVHNPSGFDVD